MKRRNVMIVISIFLLCVMLCVFDSVKQKPKEDHKPIRSHVRIKFPCTRYTCRYIYAY